MPRITGIPFLGLSVRNLRRSVAWYSALLGLETVREAPAGASWHRGAALLRDSGSGLVIGLSVHRDNSGEPFSEARTGLDHVELGVASREELEAWVARLDVFGIPHSGIQDRSLGSLVTFRDPDNIQLEFFWTKDLDETA